MITGQLAQVFCLDLFASCLKKICIRYLHTICFHLDVVEFFEKNWLIRPWNFFNPIESLLWLLGWLLPCYCFFIYLWFKAILLRCSGRADVVWLTRLSSTSALGDRGASKCREVFYCIFIPCGGIFIPYGGIFIPYGGFIIETKMLLVCVVAVAADVGRGAASRAEDRVCGCVPETDG